MNFVFRLMEILCTYDVHLAGNGGGKVTLIYRTLERRKQRAYLKRRRAYKTSRRRSNNDFRSARYFTDETNRFVSLARFR